MVRLATVEKSETAAAMITTSACELWDKTKKGYKIIKSNPDKVLKPEEMVK